MKIKSERFISAVISIMAAVLFSVSGFTAHASYEVCGTLTLICKTDDAVLSGMEMKLYRVGLRQDDGSFALDGDFAQYPVSLDDMSASAIQEAANTLENYASVDKLVPDVTGATDSEGTVIFENLTEGLYLVIGAPVDIDGMRYTPGAALVELSDDSEAFDLSVYPKFSVSEIPASGSAEYKVAKLWDNDYAALRPDSISVELYCSGELRETVVLSEKNGWTYEWQAAEDEDWRVKEKDVAEGYKVVYKSNETLIEIVNTYDSSITTDSSDTDTSSKTETSSNGGRLPQTGQLWWPVPLLSAAGLILIAVGVRLNSKRK
ncbi:Cna B-type domain-containing protein [Ruminococcus sp. Marseille-P6503]|uniref:Cna B-type domain-containing protein n=1 Tax=Ruminococcus sp. Marseille-P6503 TaxID=2364796 RepID=UPI000F52E29D|nr:Cna B-type domain-containing protein [Ruminococcus sp. Marseille-P6503]